MKVSMRRLMALAMAGTMTLMAGCSQASSSATGSSDTQSASGESGAEKTASGDKTVIEYWHCNAETQGGLVVDDLVKKFNEENDHIEVVAKYNPDMYKGLMQNLQAEAATGNTPALVQIGWAFLALGIHIQQRTDIEHLSEKSCGFGNSSATDIAG